MKRFFLYISVLLLVCNTLPAQNYKIVADKKGRMGYANEQGEIIIKCKYDIAFDFKNGIAKVGKSGKLGFINAEGKEILPVNCSEISDFKNGIAKFVKAGKSGLINEKAEIVLEPKYDFISPFNIYGKAWINIGGKINAQQKNSYAGDECVIGGKFGIISDEGKIIVEPKYNVLMEFSEVSNDWEKYPKKNDRLALNSFFDYWGNIPCTTFYKENDTLRTDCSYLAYSSSIESWSEGVGLLDENGNVLLKEDTYTKIGKPINGLLKFYHIKGKEIRQGYWNVQSKEEIVIQNTKVKKIDNTDVWSYLPDSLFIGDFCIDIAPIYKGGNSGGYFINRNGEKISADMAIMHNSDKGNRGLWFSKLLDGNVMVFDHQGNVVIEKGNYQDIGLNNPQSDEILLPAKKDGLWGLINEKEEVKLPFAYRQVGTPSFSRVLVQDDVTGNYGYLDTEGNSIVPCRFKNIYLLSEANQNNIWVQKSSEDALNDSLWYNYDIENETLSESGYVWVSTFYNKHCFVVPNNIDKYNSEAPLQFYNATIKEEEKKPLGLLTNHKGEIVFSTPIPNELSIIDVIIDYSNRINGRAITRGEHKKLILQLTKDQRSYSITETINENEWDY